MALVFGFILSSVSAWAGEEFVPAKRERPAASGQAKTSASRSKSVARRAVRVWPPKSVPVWIMSYGELMRLSPLARQQYLTELRTILIEFERRSETGIAALESRGYLDDLLAGLSVLPKSYAESSLGPPEDLDCTGSQLRALTMKGRWVCALPLSDTKIPGHNCAKTSNGKFICWNPIGHDGEPMPETPVYYNAQAMPPLLTTTTVGQPVAQATDVVTATDAIAESEPKRCGSHETEEKSGDAVVCVLKDGSAKHSGYQCDVRSEGGYRCVRTPKAQAADAVDAVDAADADADAVDAAESCQADKPVCEDREKFRQEFYGKKRACLYSGNVSSYPGAKPAKGKCKAVKAFRFSPGGTEYKCGDGKIICNPLVFGMIKKADGLEPVCIRKSSEATNDCNKVANKESNSRYNSIAELFADENNSDLSGLRESWDGYVKEIKTICDEDKASTQFHCGECRVIYDRLMALKTRFIGNVCKQAPKDSVPADGGGGVDAQPESEGTDAAPERKADPCASAICA